MRGQFSKQSPLRIGTRRSPLALAQAKMASAAIRDAHDLAEDAIILVPMLATGDKVQDRPLAEIGGKALWTKELERALIEDDIDIAVHSMKDVETVRSPLFTISAMLPRADVRDRLIGAESIEALPRGARVGTSSPRRAAQVQRLRPDLCIVPLRGNVATRLARIEAGEADATLLASAGLDRLGMPDTGHAIANDTMLPAASQGAVGIDHLSARADMAEMLLAVNDAETFGAVMAERALLEALGGNCHSPVAALARFDNGAICLRAQIYSADGAEMHEGELRMSTADDTSPAQLAADLLSAASAKVRALFDR